jgi:hypothetical protein
LLSWYLFKSMVKEEWRLHQSLVGGFGSGFFPFMIFLFTAFGAYLAPYIMGNIELTMILLMLHLVSVIYGVFVGGFGRIGEHVMTRRLGQVNLLLQLSQQYPLSFKHLMGVFYVKDSLYYLVYSYVPLVMGGGLAAKSVGVSYRTVGMLGVSMFLAFMMGMGLSFVLSALSLKSKWVTLLFGLAIFSLILLVHPMGLIPVGYLVPPIGYWITGNFGYLLATIIISSVLAAAGVFFMKERFELRQRQYDESFLSTEDKLGFMGDLRTMVAKEWLELVRSGSLFPVLTGFGGQLIAFYFILWLFQAGFGILINFNVIFFSGFVGFMGVMTYSFITNYEHNEYLNVQPVSVDMVVKAKLAIYLLLTSGSTISYVFLIGFLKGQMNLIPMGLIVSTATSLFVVAVTAYLTGLWTNTMFFGAKTILKFTAIVVPPLIFIEIASMMLEFRSQTATQVIYGCSFLLIIVAALIFSRLKHRWCGTSFSYVSTGV